MRGHSRRVKRVGEEADDYSFTNRGFGTVMSYFMSPQTHPGLLPSGQGERGAPGIGVGATASPENLRPGSGKVEVLLGILGLALKRILFKDQPFPKGLPRASHSLSHSLSKHVIT